MEIIQNILTSNNCYKSGKALNPKTLMVHSTAVPGAPAKNFLSSWNTAKPGGREVCVHGFVDGTGVYQTLPWTMQAWHCGFTFHYASTLSDLVDDCPYLEVHYLHSTMLLLYHVYGREAAYAVRYIYIPLCFYFILIHA